jgi:hypothetical protein
MGVLNNSHKFHSERGKTIIESGYGDLPVREMIKSTGLLSAGEVSEGTNAHHDL